VGFILGQHANLAYAGIDTVGEREIDDPEFPSKWDCGLRSPFSQVFEPGTASTRQYQGKRIASQPADKTRTLFSHRSHLHSHARHKYIIVNSNHGQIV
jgi:hypothetical protein